MQLAVRAEQPVADVVDKQDVPGLPGCGADRTVEHDRVARVDQRAQPRVGQAAAVHQAPCQIGNGVGDRGNVGQP